MDPQYATVDQLTEITDTMASLRDVILGLGQRIDGHQAQPFPISGSTPHDSTTPPPLPPPSRPTIQQDYTVPPPLPPPVQLAPWAGAFVLHGQALYGIEEGISRGLWAYSSPSNSKGKKLGSGPRPSNVGAIGMTRHKSPRHLLFQRQFSDTPYQMIQWEQYRPDTPFRPAGPTYLHPPPQLVYVTQAPQRPLVQYHQQYRAPPPPRPAR